MDTKVFQLVGSGDPYFKGLSNVIKVSAHSNVLKPSNKNFSYR